VISAVESIGGFVSNENDIQISGESAILLLKSRAMAYAVVSNLPWNFKEKTMSIFGKIMGAIFGTKADAAPAPVDATAGAGSTAGSSATPGQTVDVTAILDKAVAAKGEKLEWRTSIVDLMKALDLDSSLTARKELAKDLNYTGDTNDSAKMNIWLHQQVMKNLAANGGKLPPDVKW
jgi:hypothetical protein